MQKFKNRQDKILKKLPGSKAKDLLSVIKQALKKNLKKTEGKIIQKEKGLLINLGREIAQA